MVERRDVLSASNVELLAERRLRGVELALAEARGELERQRRLAAELSGRVAELEDELQQALIEPQGLRARLEQVERARRAAEQRAYAEQARREQLQEELDQLERSGREGDRVRERLTSARRTIVELEHRLAERQREVDELEHLLAATASARSRAEARAGSLEEALSQFEAQLATLEAAARARERQAELAATREPAGEPAPAPEPPPDREAMTERAPVHQPAWLSRAEQDLLRGELSLAARRVALRRSHGRLARAAQSRVGAFRALEGEMALMARPRAAGTAAPAGARAAETAAPVHAGAAEQGAPAVAPAAELLERERAARLRAEARAAELERELMVQRLRSSRARAALELLRSDLRERPAPDAPRSSVAEPPPPAPEPLGSPPAPVALGSPPAPVALGSPPAPVQGPPPASELISADRLGAALVRLRAETPAPPAEGGAEPAVGPWLEAALRRLGRRDPAGAGRLLVELLPLQQLVSSPPLRYDLELSPGLSVQLTLEEGEQRIARAGALRPLDQVDFRLRGDQQRLGRLLGARALRRVLPWRRARLDGDPQRGREAIGRLLQAPVRLGSLPGHGISLPAELTFALVAAMIPAELTRGERFTVAHRAPGASEPDAALVIAGGGRARARPPATAEIARLVIICEARSLPSVLDGGAEAAAAAGAELDGDPQALALLQRWLDRAQRR